MVKLSWFAVRSTSGSETHAKGVSRVVSLTKRKINNSATFVVNPFLTNRQPRRKIIKLLSFMRRNKDYKIAYALRRRVDITQLTTRARLGIMMSGIGIIIVGAIVTAFQDHRNDFVLDASFVAVFVMYCNLVLFSSLWLRVVNHEDSYLIFMRRFQIIQLLLGSSWAAVMVFGISAGDADQRGLIYALAIGLISTTMVSGPARYALSFWFPATLGAFFAFLNDPTHFYTPIFASLVCYAALSFYSILTINKKMFDKELNIVELEKHSETIELLLTDFKEGSGSFLWDMNIEYKIFGFEQHFDIDAIAGQPAGFIHFFKLLDFVDDRRGVGRRKSSISVVNKVKRMVRDRMPFKDITICVPAKAGPQWWSLSGKPIYDAKGQFMGYRGVSTDITEKEEYRQKIEFNAARDYLTKTFNRASFNKILDELCATAGQSPAALLCLDLDHFKAVNDNYGHAAGDTLLVAVAQRIASCVRSEDSVFRLGGDEFAIAMPGGTQETAVRVARRVVEKLSEPFTFQQTSFKIGACVGIAFIPNDGMDATAVHRKADLALYRAKAEERGTYRIFDRNLDHPLELAQAMQLELGLAIGRGQFEIAYQPVVDLKTRRVVCAEALLRWNHPTYGIINPARFIPMLEQSGQIAVVGCWVIDKALQVARYTDEEIRIAINLSPVQLIDAGFAGKVAAMLGASGVRPDRIEFEITESSLLARDTNKLSVLQEIKALGCRIALDDFGTGYSSMRLLDDFQFDKLKIDGTFIRDGATDVRRSVILESMIHLGQNLGLIITGEGIENAEQAERLLLLGCCEGQGFYFYQPMERDVFIETFGKIEPTMEKPMNVVSPIGSGL